MDYDLSYDLGYEGCEGSPPKPTKPSHATASICDPHQEHPGYWCAPPPKVCKVVNSAFAPECTAEERADIVAKRNVMNAKKAALDAATKAVNESTETDAAKTKPLIDAQSKAQQEYDAAKAAYDTAAGVTTKTPPKPGTGVKAKSDTPEAPPPPPEPAVSTYVPASRVDSVLKAKQDGGATYAPPKDAAPEVERPTYTSDQLQKRGELQTKLREAFAADKAFAKDKTPAEINAAADAYLAYLEKTAEEEKKSSWAKENLESLFEKSKPDRRGKLPPTKLVSGKTPRGLLDDAIGTCKTKAATAAKDYHGDGSDRITQVETEAKHFHGDKDPLHGDKDPQILLGLMEREATYKALKTQKATLKNNGDEIIAAVHLARLKAQGLTDTVNGNQAPKPATTTTLAAAETRPQAATDLLAYLTRPTEKPADWSQDEPFAPGKGMAPAEAKLAMQYFRFPNPNPNDKTHPTVGVDEATPEQMANLQKSLPGKNKDAILADAKQQASDDLVHELRVVNPTWTDADAHRFVASRGLYAKGKTVYDFDEAIRTLRASPGPSPNDSAALASTLEKQDGELFANVDPALQSKFRQRVPEPSGDDARSIADKFGLENKGKGKEYRDQFLAQAAGLAFQEKLKLAGELAKEQRDNAEYDRREGIKREQAVEDREDEQAFRAGESALQREHDKEMKGMDFMMQIVGKQLDFMNNMVTTYMQAYLQANMPKQYDAMLAQNVWLTVQGGGGAGRRA
ncbi:MAG: hypothetical protein HYU97_10205 [Deltaproteobacteria bacterium]|nr:hypothetical protein [Deltaproteobacteria bacterium]